MQKGVKFRIYPNKNQRGLINQTFGCCRFIYNNIIKVPTMYPSSQTCSCCGYKNPLVKNLAVRKWECPNCHTKHDRDANASVNILNKGLSIA